MLKTLIMPAAAIAVATAAWVLVPMRAHEAAAQSGSFEVHFVEYDIVPGKIDAYLAALEENAAATIKEPGVHEFDILRSDKDPNHVAIFEVYDNAAAAESHMTTDHFKKYKAATTGMTTNRQVKTLVSVSMNVKGK
jgi:(4S)-4-hydroxy-5-phosphonooxypentane-2,3-dione isomerase